MNLSETNENGSFCAYKLMYLWNSLAQNSLQVSRSKIELMSNRHTNIPWNGEFWEGNVGLFCLKQKTRRANV